MERELLLEWNVRSWAKLFTNGQPPSKTSSHKNENCAELVAKILGWNQREYMAERVGSEFEDNERHW